MMEFKTKRMDLATAAASEPVHLAEIRWFEVDHCSYSTRERRAVYFKEFKWSDHAWGRDRGAGADFVGQWTLETRYPRSDSWSADGRAEGWSGIDPASKGKHETAQDAALALRSIVDREAVRLEERLAMLNGVRDKIAAALEGGEEIEP